MYRFRNDLNKGSKALWGAIFNEDNSINEQIDICLADFEAPEDYTPFWITNAERKALNSDTFVERVNGKLTVYKNAAKEGFDAFATKDEVANNPTIKEEAAAYQEMIEKYHYEFIEFEGEKFVRVMDKNSCPDPRNIIMTKAFRMKMNERYGDSAYVVTTARDVLFAFSISEDPFNVLNDIVCSDLGELDSEYEVILIQKDQLIKIFTLTTYIQENLDQTSTKCI